jgi:hypothetical protein
VFDDVPDARDGLTRLERIILWQLSELQKETGRESIPTALLYGRVIEHIDVSVDELVRVLQKHVLSPKGTGSPRGSLASNRRPP